MPIPMLPPAIGGPVFRLRYLGPVCPCLERPEDGAAREALQKCTGLPVRYHRRVAGRGDEGGALAAALSSVSGLFGGGGGGGERKGDASSSSSAGGGASFVKGPATLSVVDTVSGPAIRVETEPDEREGATRVDEDGTVLPIDTRHRRTVPLRKIATIRAIDGSFLGMGMGGGPSLVAVVGRARGSPELLRFNVLDAAGRKAEDADRRDEVIGRLGGLVEWDRRRRAAAGDTDTSNENEGADADDDKEEAFENDEDGGSTSRRGAVPKGRAAKAAYFAKREIELTQQRREREKRKARYLEGSGGLKYTAIAMANKAEMT